MDLYVLEHLQIKSFFVKYNQLNASSFTPCLLNKNLFFSRIWILNHLIIFEFSSIKLSANTGATVDGKFSDKDS